MRDGLDGGAVYAVVYHSAEANSIDRLLSKPAVPVHSTNADGVPETTLEFDSGSLPTVVVGTHLQVKAILK